MIVQDLISQLATKDIHKEVVFFIAPDFNLEYTSATIQSSKKAGVVGIYIGTEELGAVVKVKEVAEEEPTSTSEMVEEITEYLQTNADREEVKRIYNIIAGIE